MTSDLNRFVIGISGQSGSGKTYFIERLKEILQEKVAVISFDDYYKPIEEQKKDDLGITNFDLPEALYHERFQEDLLKLIEGHPVLLKRYNFENYDAPEQVIVVESAPVIIAEGLFVFDFADVDALLSYRIFIEADMDLSLQRRLARDNAERGIPEERSLYQWHKHVIPAWENHIYPHKFRCDLVINNSGPAEDNITKILSGISSTAHPEVMSLIASRLV